MGVSVQCVGASVQCVGASVQCVGASVQCVGASVQCVGTSVLCVGLSGKCVCEYSPLHRARPYHRMKLMLVGKAARGKTTLLMRISERGQRGVQETWGTKRSG